MRSTGTASPAKHAVFRVVGVAHHNAPVGRAPASTGSGKVISDWCFIDTKIAGHWENLPAVLDSLISTNVEIRAGSNPMTGREMVKLATVAFSGRNPHAQILDLTRNFYESSVAYLSLPGALYAKIAEPRPNDIYELAHWLEVVKMSLCVRDVRSRHSDMRAAEQAGFQAVAMPGFINGVSDKRAICEAYSMSGLYNPERADRKVASARVTNQLDKERLEYEARTRDDPESIFGAGYVLFCKGERNLATLVEAEEAYILAHGFRNRNFCSSIPYVVYICKAKVPAVASWEDMSGLKNTEDIINTRAGTITDGARGVNRTSAEALLDFASKYHPDSRLHSPVEANSADVYTLACLALLAIRDGRERVTMRVEPKGEAKYRDIFALNTPGRLLAAVVENTGRKVSSRTNIVSSRDKYSDIVSFSSESIGRSEEAGLRMDESKPELICTSGDCSRYGPNFCVPIFYAVHAAAYPAGAPERAFSRAAMSAEFDKIMYLPESLIRYIRELGSVP